MSIRLNPISAARGAKFPCEICAAPSTLACAHCRVTFYCSKQHQSVDWSGIHEKICTMMGSLRNPPETLNSEEERKRRKLVTDTNHHALIELSVNESSKFLVQGQFELAIPAALLSLKLGITAFGKGQVELVPSYMLLAEANMGLRRFAQAEEFLLLAKWGAFKNPEKSEQLRSPLCRLFGKVYLAQGRISEALNQLAQDIYYSSVEHGPEHYNVTGGYFHMGLAFLKQDQVENCLAFFDKVVDIWFKFLTNLRQQPEGQSISKIMNDTSLGEAADILRSTIDTRVEFLGNGHIATGEASYVLGMLCHLTGHYDKAQQLYASAVRIYEVHVGQDHDLTKDIQAALSEIEGHVAAVQSITRPDTISIPT